jgi:hypothetical protein
MNVVDVQLKICRCSPLLVNKERGVGDGRYEAETPYVRGEPLVLRSRCLL